MKLIKYKGRRVYEGLITELKDDQIFVFGSNPEGKHGSGAAKIAVEKFGAEYGVGYGREGKSFALITKNLTPDYKHDLGFMFRKAGERSIPSWFIMASIADMMLCASINPYTDYLIAYTASGKNLNGYSAEEMADMFAEVMYFLPTHHNIIFEKEFSDLVYDKLNEK